MSILESLGPTMLPADSSTDLPSSVDDAEPVQSPGYQHHSPLLQLRLNESKHPDVSAHSCSHCKHIVISTAPETKGREQVMRVVSDGEDGPDSEQSLMTSAWARKAASHDCALFASLLGKTSYNSLSTRLDTVLHFQFYSQDDQSAFQILECEEESARFTFSRVLGAYELYAIPGSESSSDTLLPPNLVPASDLTCTRARSWLDDCRENHTGCNKFNLVYMPTRVLEVMPDSSLSEPGKFTVRLVENPESGPYATLSYCWGGEQPFKTTQAKLDRYKRKIQLTDLAQTIKDALTVVFSLGVNYLWVDALCIIQDDEKDMMREITNMHRIYRGSLFTIAATVAQSSQEGFLHPRTAYRGFKVKIQSADGIIAERLAIPVRIPADFATYPLYKRAWTFQEDSLSTRILAYGNRGLVYKCLQASHVDGGHQKCSLWRFGYEYSPGTLLAQLRPGSQQLRSADHPLAWGGMVQDYINRLLTFPEDKLLAIAALAEEYARTQPVSQYLAGMWREDFLHQCLWQRSRQMPPDHPGIFRPGGRYRAPSWSWASLDDPFHSFSVGSHREGATPTFYCKLLDVQTTLAEETNRFGRVTGGSLRIYGRMRRLVWVAPRYTVQGTLDGHGWAYEIDNSIDSNDESRADKRLDFIVDDLKAWPEGTKVAMWCMEFCTFPAPDNFVMVARTQFSQERGSHMLLKGLGLLLMPVSEEETTQTPTTFKRMGVVSFKGLPKEDPFFERERYWFDDGQCEWREIIII